MTTAQREALADMQAARALAERYARRDGDPCRELGIVVSPFVDKWQAADDLLADTLAEARRTYEDAS